MFEAVVVYKIEGRYARQDGFKSKREAKVFLRQRAKAHRLILRNDSYADRDFYTIGLNELEHHSLELIAREAS